MDITVFYLIVHVNLKKEEINQQRPNFYRADYRLIREYMSQVNWCELKGLNTEDS